MTSAELRHLRLSHGLTQRAFAALLGYTANYIARLERGDAPITPRLVLLASSVLEMPAQKKRDSGT